MAGFGDGETRKVCIHATVTTRTSKERQGLSLCGRFIRWLAIWGDSRLCSLKDQKTVLHCISSRVWIQEKVGRGLEFRERVNQIKDFLSIPSPSGGDSSPAPWAAAALPEHSGSDPTWSLAVLLGRRSHCLWVSWSQAGPAIHSSPWSNNCLHVSVTNLLTI